MTLPVHVFTTNVKDRLGWGYPSALVVVRQASTSSQNTYVSESCEGNYTNHSAVEAVAYRANFWGNVEMQQQRLPSRPLINLDNTEDEDLFSVDLDHPQSVQILNSALTQIEKEFKLIELDVTRRFA